MQGSGKKKLQTKNKLSGVLPPVMLLYYAKTNNLTIWKS